MKTSGEHLKATAEQTALGMYDEELAAIEILDIGQVLIQTRGYTAMSFQDIADQVDIKKPSVIYHFSSKADLGAAIIQCYRDTCASQLEAIRKDPLKTSWEA